MSDDHDRKPVFECHPNATRTTAMLNPFAVRYTSSDVHKAMHCANDALSVISVLYQASLGMTHPDSEGFELLLYNAKKYLEDCIHHCDLEVMKSYPASD